MVTEDDNATIERMIEEGKSAIAIRAAVPDVSRTNVYLKIAKFKKHGTVGRVQTKTLGRPRVMNEGIDKFLQGLLAAKPDMELEEMRRHMQDQLNLTVSMSTISRAISRSGITSGRPNRARASTRRKNKVPATAEHVEGVVEEGTTLSSENDTTNLVATASDATWEHMQPGTPHSQQSPYPQQQPQPQNPSHPQQQHALLQAPTQIPQPDLHHALDPSLAQPYPLPTPYHSVYPDLSGSAAAAAAHVAAVSVGGAVVIPPSMDVYRSPYAPIQPSDTHVHFP